MAGRCGPELGRAAGAEAEGGAQLAELSSPPAASLHRHQDHLQLRPSPAPHHRPPRLAAAQGRGSPVTGYSEREEPQIAS